MGWRNVVAHRKRRHQREMRDLPPRMRVWDGDSRWLLVHVLVLGGLPVVGAVMLLRDGEYGLAALIAGGLVLAALFARWVRRTHRSRNATDLRGERPPESIEWEQ